MAAERMILRKMWREDEPARFNVVNKERAAAQLGGKLRPRLPFQLWCLKTFRPAVYKRLLAKAHGQPVTAGEVTVTDPSKLDQVIPNMEEILANELAASRNGGGS